MKRFIPLLAAVFLGLAVLIAATTSLRLYSSSHQPATPSTVVAPAPAPAPAPAETPSPKPVPQAEVPVPATPPATAPEPPVPPAMVEYMGRTIAQTMSFHGANWLIRQEREAEESTSAFIRELRLQPGQTVCDLGSGNGYHSCMMARLVAPAGRVLAVDIQPEMLDLLRRRMAQESVTNIEPILGALHDPKLPPASCDLILLADVYHEFDRPVSMLAGIHKALKPGGLAALLEFRSEDPKVPIKPEHKMSKEQIMKEWSANGFELVRSFDDLPWQHLMFFRAK